MNSLSKYFFLVILFLFVKKLHAQESNDYYPRTHLVSLRFYYTWDGRNNFFINPSFAKYVKPRVIRGFGLVFEKRNYVPYYGPFTNWDFILKSRMIGIYCYHEWLPFKFGTDAVKMYFVAGITPFYENIKYQTGEYIDVDLVGAYFNFGFGPMITIRKRLSIIPSVEYQIGKGFEASSSLCQGSFCDNHELKRRGLYQWAQAYLTIKYGFR